MRAAKTPVFRSSASSSKHLNVFSQTDRLVEQLTKTRDRDRRSADDTSDESLVRYLTTETFAKSKQAGNRGSNTRGRRALEDESTRRLELEEKVALLLDRLKAKEEEV